MFDFIRANTRVLFFILLVLIIPSFVFVGVDGYQRMDQGANHSVAKVAGSKISQAEWDAAHRQRTELMLGQQPDRDPRSFDTSEEKLQSLEGLVRQRVVAAAAKDLHMVISDERLNRLFYADPQYANLRNAEGVLDKSRLADRNSSPGHLVAQLRQSYSDQQVIRGVTDSVVAGSAVARATFDALFQQREVQVLSFRTQEQIAGVKPSDADIEAFYRDPVNAARFKAAEQADIEYVVLDIESMKKGVVVGEDALKEYYKQNLPRFTAPEERRASHVLIKAGKEASSADRAKAKAKAEGLLAEIRAKPASFAEVARKNSDDPGSAERGGDLDFFGRKFMVKPFEDAVFSLQKIGDLSGLVETDYGFHIIQLTGQRGGEIRPFESVRTELENEVRTEQAQKKFAEVATEFSNVVYEQADSLKPAAEKFKLEIQSAKAVTRNPQAEPGSVLLNARLLELLFADDSVRNKRNTEAVDLGRSRLAAARVVKHTPARLLPFEEVRDSVRLAVTMQQAAALARKEGLAKLAALKEAPETPLTEPVLKLSRLQSGKVPEPLLSAVLRAPTASLPSFLGVDLGEQGYLVVKVTKVLPSDDDPVRSRTQYSQIWADAEARAYYAALKKRFKAKISAEVASAESNVLN